MKSSQEPEDQGPPIPHSREAEEAVLGAIFINPEAFYEVAHKLRLEDFYIHRHRWVWEAFEELHKKHHDFDMITISNYIDSQGKLEEIGGPAFLTTLINSTPTSLNIESYADIVITHALRRRAITSANQIAATAFDEENSSEDVISKVMEEAIKLATHTSEDKRLHSARQASEKEWARLEKVSKDGIPPGIKTGYKDIDTIIGNLAPGDLNLIAGRPGAGKTSFLQCVAQNNLNKTDKKILIVQVTDLDRSAWMQRLMSMQSNIPLSNIRTGRMQDEQMHEYAAAFEKVAEFNFMIDDTPAMTVEKLFSVARRAKALLRGLDLVIVDYIQKMGVPKTGRKWRNRVDEVDHITSNLKYLARELNVPVLAAAQLSRGVEHRADGRPALSDLRESGALEQDSQIVMFLHRKEGESITTNITEIIVAKNTNGPVGSAELVWRGEVTRFEDAQTRRLQVDTDHTV